MTNPNGNRPVYRYPPRSHADSCRCPRCEPFRRQAKGGPAYQYIDRNGIIGPAILVIGGIILTCFWPVLVWHGEGGVTGTDWRWDIHSTIAELVYLGSVSFVIFLCWLGSRPAKTAVPAKGRLGVEATPQPPASLPAPCRCNWCRGRAGVHGVEAVALYLREAAAASGAARLAAPGPEPSSLPFTPRVPHLPAPRRGQGGRHHRPGDGPALLVPGLRPRGQGAAPGELDAPLLRHSTRPASGYRPPLQLPAGCRIMKPVSLLAAVLALAACSPQAAAR